MYVRNVRTSVLTYIYPYYVKYIVCSCFYLNIILGIILNYSSAINKISSSSSSDNKDAHASEKLEMLEELVVKEEKELTNTGG